MQVRERKSSLPRFSFCFPCPDLFYKEKRKKDLVFLVCWLMIAREKGGRYEFGAAVRRLASTEAKKWKIWLFCFPSSRGLSLALSLSLYVSLSHSELFFFPSFSYRNQEEVRIVLFLNYSDGEIIFL